MCTAIIPYYSPKVFMKFLYKEIEKYQEKQLFELIQKPTCYMGSIENDRINVWMK